MTFDYFNICLIIFTGEIYDSITEKVNTKSYHDQEESIMSTNYRVVMQSKDF